MAMSGGIDSTMASLILHESGYEVIGFTGSWESTDALHCRIKGIPDLNLLQIFHEPIDDFTQESISGFDVNVKIDNLNELIKSTPFKLNNDARGFFEK